MSLTVRLGARLRERQLLDLHRSRREVMTPQRARIMLPEGERVNFSSNDYLGLAGNEIIAEAMARALSRYGAGAGASHLVTGHMTPHRELEERLAELTGAPRALLFPNGYMANLATVTTLAERRTLVLSDRLNHASLIDAGILSRARVRRYRHLDDAQVGASLDQADAGALILTDSVFSMDGDIAPLNRLDALAGARDALLIVDDAHGFGVLGEGRGALRHFDLSAQAVMMGTLGKAAGVYGAFVAASEVVIESLIQYARPYIYTTALPPAVAAGCVAALELLRTEHWRRERLASHVSRFRRAAADKGILLMQSDTPIQPVLLGSASAAMEASRRLERDGYLVTAIRPPTVPKDTSRLRITLSAAHGEAQVDGLVEALAGVLDSRGECHGP